MDKEQICAELDGVRNDYRELLDTATVAELRKPTDGTKWNNEQLLFHMLFGYLLVRNLRLLVWGFSRLPESASMRLGLPRVQLTRGVWRFRPRGRPVAVSQTRWV